MAFSVKICSFVLGIVLLSLLVGSEAGICPSLGFIKTRNCQFVLNGRPFLFNGFNSHWMMSVGADPKERGKISSVFCDAASVGLTIGRTWAFSDGGKNALQTSPGVYDEKVFQSLDFVIAEARKYGIRLILSLTNNWNEYGGKHQYVEWAKKTPSDSATTNNDDDDFFTNKVVKGFYKDHVKKILTRNNTILGIPYKDDTTIMAWELMNQPRSAENSTKSINEWVQEMATYVKSIDSNHLLTVGMEGFYGTEDRKQCNPNAEQVGTDFIANHKIKEIDFSTIHAYPDAWLPKECYYNQMAFMQDWMVNHWMDSMRHLNKPLVFSEFGMNTKNSTCKLGPRNSFLSATYSYIYNLARRRGPMSGGLVWQLLAEDMDSYDDGHSIVLSKDCSTANIIAQHSYRMSWLCQYSLKKNLRH